MRRGDFVASLIIGLVPVALLGAFGLRFYIDWTNTVWMAAYFGEWFARHASFPVVLNTHQVVGVPFPVLYGFLFFPIAGVLSSVLSADLSIRLLCATVSVLQTWFIIAACRRFGAPRGLAWIVSLLYSWRVYAMTNLYNRSDVAEFIAFSLVTIAVASWIAFVKGRWSEANLIPGLAFALAAGTHALTGVFGGARACLMFVGVVLHTHSRRRLLAVFAANSILVLIVLSPWLYAVLTLRSSLAVLRESSSLHYSQMDAMLMRLLPFPFDPRSVTDGVHVSTPYLDAQIAVPLALFTVTVLSVVRHYQSRTTLVPFIAAGLILLVSAVPSIGFVIPAIATVQFPYRLINYVDLLLLVTIFVAFSLMRANDYAALTRPRLRSILTICLTLSAVSVSIKYEHGFAIARPDVLPGTQFFKNRDGLLDLPGEFYGVSDYIDPVGTGPLQSSTALPVSGGAAFGEVGTGTGNVTDIEAFAWNRVVVKGAPVAAAPAARTQFGAFGGAALALQQRSNFTYAVDPPVEWISLRRLSGVTLSLWFLAMIAAPLLRARLRATAQGVRRFTRARHPVD